MSSLQSRLADYFERNHMTDRESDMCASLAVVFLTPELERLRNETEAARQHSRALEASLSEQEAWSKSMERRLSQSSDRVQRLLDELERDPASRVGRCGAPAPRMQLGAEYTEPATHCALPAGHAGWHRDDFGDREWNGSNPPHPVDMGCPHCPDGHTPPTGGSQPWGAFVGPERDSDGQPTTIYVMRSAGAHVAESDANWMYQVLNGKEAGR